MGNWKIENTCTGPFPVKICWFLNPLFIINSKYIQFLHLSRKSMDRPSPAAQKSGILTLDVEHFWNGSVREPYKRSLYERTFSSVYTCEKPAYQGRKTVTG